MDDEGDDDPVPLPNVNAAILKKVKPRLFGLNIQNCGHTLEQRFSTFTALRDPFMTRHTAVLSCVTVQNPFTLTLIYLMIRFWMLC